MKTQDKYTVLCQITEYSFNAVKDVYIEYGDEPGFMQKEDLLELITKIDTLNRKRDDENKIEFSGRDKWFVLLTKDDAFVIEEFNKHFPSERAYSIHYLSSDEISVKDDTIDVCDLYDALESNLIPNIQPIQRKWINPKQYRAQIMWSKRVSPHEAKVLVQDNIIQHLLMQKKLFLRLASGMTISYPDIFFDPGKPHGIIENIENTDEGWMMTFTVPEPYIKMVESVEEGIIEPVLMYDGEGDRFRILWFALREKKNINMDKVYDGVSDRRQKIDE
jgi:hypothetical protein